jgi:hypothetical protein
VGGLARDRSGVVENPLDTVVVMFLVAYLFSIGNAFLISYMPHVDASGDLVPRVHFSLASTIEYRTVFLSWFALLPLLEANGFGHLAYVLYFLLPASLLLGSVIVAMAADGLGLLRVWETYPSAAVATGLALAYAAIAAFVVPDARSPQSPLYLTLVIFCVNTVGFGLAGLTPLSKRYADNQGLLRATRQADCHYRHAADNGVAHIPLARCRQGDLNWSR